MKHPIIGFVLIFIFCSSASAQPDTLWTRTYGGSYIDKGYSVQQTSDSGYIIAGYTGSFGVEYSNVYLIKTDGYGSELWTQILGGNNSCSVNTVLLTTDGGYFTAGEINSYGTNYDDVYLVKTDEYGFESWNYSYGGSNDDAAYNAEQTLDGGYIIVGYTYSYGAGESDVYVIKTDESGNELWGQTFGGNSWDRGRCIQQTLDNGYIIVGYTFSFGFGGSDVYLIKTDEYGNAMWTKTIGEDSDEYGYYVQQTSDGGYIITGFKDPINSCPVVYLIKTDSNGNELWSNTFGSIYGNAAYCVQEVSDAGYVLVGGSYSDSLNHVDVFVVKTNANGDEVWEKSIGGINDDIGHFILQTIDEGYIIAGYTESYGAGYSDVYLIRLDSEGNLVEDFGKHQPAFFTLHPSYPNPFNASTLIRFDLRSAGLVKLDIYDISGRSVGVQNFEPLHQWMTAGSHEIIFDGAGLASGIYFAKLTAGDISQTQKMVLMK